MAETPCAENARSPNKTVPVYEIRPRSDKRGVDLISEALSFGRLWYGERNAESMPLCGSRGLGKAYRQHKPAAH